MKTQFIKLTENSGIVDLPEGATNPEVQYVGSGVFLWWEDGSEYGSFTRLPWDAEMYSLAEETAARLVDKLLFDFVCPLLEFKGYFLKNPYGEKEPVKSSEWTRVDEHTRTMETTHSFKKRLNNWRSAEEKTFKNPVLLIKKEVK